MAIRCTDEGFKRITVAVFENKFRIRVGDGGNNQ